MRHEQVKHSFAFWAVHTETRGGSFSKLLTLEGVFRFLRFQPPKMPLPCKRKALLIKYFGIFTCKRPRVNRILKSQFSSIYWFNSNYSFFFYISVSQYLWKCSVSSAECPFKCSSCLNVQCIFDSGYIKVLNCSQQAV